MDADEKEYALAMQEVKRATDDLDAQATVQALLTLIPYAGGVLSTIFSEYRGRRNTKRIFETLDALKSELEKKPTKQDILNKDEVVEIIYSTMEEIIKTSNEEKVGYLRDSLIKAFINEGIPYPQKQHYLEVLKGLSIGELQLLKVIYMSGDPFEERENIPPVTSYDTVGLGLQQVSFNFVTLPSIPEYKEPEVGNTLSDIIKRDLSISEGAVEGLIKSLDSKGLTNIAPNLMRKTVKTLRPMTLSQLDAIPAQSIVSFQPNAQKGTPIEASRTKFGEDFIQYIRSKF